MISTGWPESFCYERVCLLRWRGWSSGWAVCGHAGGRPGERGRAAEMRRCAGAARGSCARRSSSGLGVPTAFNRAGEGPRAGRGGAALGFRRGGPQRPGGLAPPVGKWPVVFARAAAGMRLAGGLACGYAAMAWWWPSSPAAIRASHRVPCTVSDQIQRSSDAAHAARACSGTSLLSSSRLVKAACLAASTSQCRSTAQVARQAASRSRAGRAGRSLPGRGSCRTRCGPETSRHA